ncbi:MAG: hypothetical protein FAZ92_03267 [Accumulibacter sp.]|nr:MAG: hypothetical protein FAZ92_03267 [Accumulibacter sp.]
MGQSNRLGGRNLVPTIEVDRCQIGGGDCVVENDHLSRLDHIACIGGDTGRGPIADVPIPPDLGSAEIGRAVQIGRVGDVEIVTVLPLIVVDHRVIGRGSNRDIGLHRVCRCGISRNGLQPCQQLVFREWHVEQLDWGGIRAIRKRCRRRLAGRHVVGRAQLTVLAGEDRLGNEHQGRVERTLRNHPSGVDASCQRAAVVVEPA